MPSLTSMRISDAPKPKKRLLVAALAVAALLASAPAALALVGTEAGLQQQAGESVPKLNIPLPNVNLTKPFRDGSYITVPFLAQYIAGVYKFLISIVGIVAAVMMMIGGFQYLTAGGDMGRVKLGREKIVNAITGLVLALGSYVMLYAISPDLVAFEGLRIFSVTPESLAVQDSGDSDSGIPDGTFSLPNITCPRSGGAAAIPSIIASLQGKVAYRFGGKGGPPPYGEIKPEYLKYKDACPPGNVCLDCSGFVNLVLGCAGMPAPGGGTASMFNNAERISSIDSKKRTVNGTTLEPGDLFGYRPEDSAGGIGHVLLYIGDGQVAQSSGGDKGRQPGANPNIGPMPSDNNVYKYIRRINPVPQSTPFDNRYNPML